MFSKLSSSQNIVYFPCSARCHLAGAYVGHSPPFFLGVEWVVFARSGPKGCFQWVMVSASRALNVEEGVRAGPSPLTHTEHPQLADRSCSASLAASPPELVCPGSSQERQIPPELLVIFYPAASPTQSPWLTTGFQDATLGICLKKDLKEFPANLV